MATTLHEWKCVRCGKTAWSRTKNTGHFIRKVVLCPACKRPMIGTGEAHKRYSTRELL